MPLKLYNESDVQDIADAIRNKNGSSYTYKVSEMAAAISAIGDYSKPVLPPSYQQVEYIESTGTQYIDTGLIPTGNNIAYIDFEITGYTNSGYIALVSAATHMYLVHFAHSNGNEIRFVPCWYTYGGGNVYSCVSLNKRYHSYCSSINIDSAGGAAVTLEGAFCGNGTSSPQEYLPTNSYYIFARNNGNGSVAYQSKAKLYRLTIYTDEVKRREFYPCYRKSDGVIGLYDTVNDVFYTNIGTGTFGKGGDV